ncbi:MAG: hypothetical protein DDT18_01730 [Actinobacteria bacterium]|nr:hypothetical protein [Actinomycetota bacterium]
MRCVDLLNFVNKGIEIIKVTVLTIRLNHFIRFSLDLFIRSKSAAPAIGRNINVLKIGKPKSFIIACSIYYLNNITAIIINTPSAIIAA